MIELICLSMDWSSQTEDNVDVMGLKKKEHLNHTSDFDEQIIVEFFSV